MYVEIKTVLNNQWVKKEIKEEIRNISRQIKTYYIKMYGTKK